MSPTPLHTHPMSSSRRARLGAVVTVRRRRPAAACPFGRGDVLDGRYRLRWPLGRGASGTVFEGVELGGETPLAIKLVELSAGGDPDGAWARLEREATVTVHAMHPGVVPVLDLGRVGSTGYIVMELVRGDPLSDLVGPGVRLEPAVAIAIARGIADVLRHTHRLPLVHRDLKPAHVILDPDAGARWLTILDFGLSFLPGDPQLGALAEAGVVEGTPAYMAPEQAEGDRPVGPLADIYALGCILFEMLTGTPPFRDTVEAVLEMHQFSSPPRLERFGRLPAYAYPLEALVSTMLSKEPGDRPTAAQVAERLRELSTAAPP
jgi:serine/threonine protein kinase